MFASLSHRQFVERRYYLGECEVVVCNITLPTASFGDNAERDAHAIALVVGVVVASLKTVVVRTQSCEMHDIRNAEFAEKPKAVGLLVLSSVEVEADKIFASNSARCSDVGVEVGDKFSGAWVNLAIGKVGMVLGFRCLISSCC